MKATKLVQTTIAAAILGWASVGAHAAPVSEFYFSQSAGFLDPTDVDPGTFFDPTSGLIFNGVAAPTGGSPYPANTYGYMSWSGVGGYGTDGNASSLSMATFTSAANFEVVGNGDSKWESGEQWIITNIHQRNEALVRGNGGVVNDPLWIADAVANLRIFSDSVGGTAVHQELGSTTRLSFNETFNQFGNQSYCSYYNPWTTACDDIYTVAAGGFAPTTFMYDYTEYQLDFGLIPGALSSPGSNAIVCPSIDPRCAGWTGGPGIIQIFTPETAPGESDIYVTMSWRAIPEPGSVALVGLGLLALGAMRRRKSTAA